MTRESTVDTTEFRLGRTIALLHAAPRREVAARVPRVHSDEGNACVVALVFEEEAQLVERPTRMLVAPCLANRCPIADAGQVFDSNSASGACGLQRDLLRDMVV